MTADTLAIAALGGGLIAVSCLAAVTWTNRPRLRLLPPFYGLIAGATAAIAIQGETNAGPIIESALVGGSMGIAMYFVIWLNVRD